MSPIAFFTSSHVGPALVVRLGDRDVGSLADTQLRAELDQIVAAGKDSVVEGIVVDFNNLKYFGSSLLEALLIIWKPVRDRGGKMAVCGVSPTGREILELARFNTLWKICGTQEEAVAEIQRKAQTT